MDMRLEAGIIAREHFLRQGWHIHACVTLPCATLTWVENMHGVAFSTACMQLSQHTACMEREAARSQGGHNTTCMGFNAADSMHEDGASTQFA